MTTARQPGARAGEIESTGQAPAMRQIAGMVTAANRSRSPPRRALDGMTVTFMHCLPAFEVFRSGASIISAGTESRLHTINAVLVATSDKTRKERRQQWQP